MFKRALIAAIALFSIASSATADVLVGTPTNNPNQQDCIPFGCGVPNQFIFDSSYFSGPISITELQFFNSIQDPDPKTPDRFDPGTYTFKLATSTNDYLSPSAIFAANVGADVQLFATVVIGSDLVPPVFSFAGAAFNYNPANGDLLLEVDKAGSNNTLSAFFDYNGPDDPNFKVSRIWNFDPSPSGDVNINYGPVTNFISTAVSPSPVPEPMTLTLTGLGLAGIAARLKKSRKQN